MLALLVAIGLDTDEYLKGKYHKAKVGLVGVAGTGRFLPEIAREDGLVVEGYAYGARRSSRALLQLSQCLVIPPLWYLNFCRKSESRNYRLDLNQPFTNLEMIWAL